MKIKTNEFNNIIQETKLRTTGTGIVTTIPKNVIQVLGLSVNDIIIWTIDNKNQTVQVNIKRTNKK